MSKIKNKPPKKSFGAKKLGDMNKRLHKKTGVKIDKQVFTSRKYGSK